MPTLETLQDLLVAELQDLYNAENQILKALPKMAKKATSEELRTAFEEHLQQTEQQVTRLEQAMQLMDVPVKGKTCAGMKGIIEEGKEMMEEDAGDDVMDAALIAAAQKVEHYEIASYGAVRSYAALLGLEDVQELLALTLQEEEETDRRLTEIAEGAINAQAMEGDDEGEEQPATSRGKAGTEEEAGDEEEEGEEVGSARRPGNGGRGGRKGHRGGRDKSH